MRPPLLSASQIGLWRECQRKWAFRYVVGIRDPPSPSQALGIEVDDTQLQPYLRDGRPFDFNRPSGYIAAAGMEFLPLPKSPGLEVQKHFILPSKWSGEYEYQGFIDLWLPNPKAMPGAFSGAPVVADFKTTSDLKWAKSEEALSKDVQAMLYAMYAIEESRAESVNLIWIYFQTKGARRAKRVHLHIHQDWVAEQFEGIERSAAGLFAAKKAEVDPLSLPPSPAQCEAYGGCPFRSKCNLSPIDHMAAWAAKDMRSVDMCTTDTNTLMANLAARKKKAGAQPGQTPASFPVAPEPSLSLPEALGINPPEKDLPVPAEPEAPPAEAKKRGRPKKVPPFTDTAPAEEAPKQLALPFDGIDYVKLAKAVAEELIARLVLGGGK